MSGPFAKIWAPHAENDSSKPPENFRETAIPTKSFDWITLYSFPEKFN